MVGADGAEGVFVPAERVTEPFPVPSTVGDGHVTDASPVLVDALIAAGNNLWVCAMDIVPTSDDATNPTGANAVSARTVSPPTRDVALMPSGVRSCACNMETRLTRELALMPTSDNGGTNRSKENPQIDSVFYTIKIKRIRPTWLTQHQGGCGH
jgi:hypothetical protein